jgi:4-amino-4-deoxy-L-arabinose transferase-like glycosyltransferase
MNTLSVIAKLESLPRWMTLGSILGLAILLRAVVIIALPAIGDPNAMDAQNYLLLARSLVESGGFMMWGKPSAYVAPGYPFFLAGVFKIFGENFLAVKIIQVFLGAATAWLGYAVAQHFTRPAVALLAALIIAVHPELVGVTAFIYTEALFIFLLMASVLLVSRAMASGKLLEALSSGALWGLTTLCRGTTLYFPFFLLALTMLASSLRQLRLRQWLLFAAGMAIIMAPWAIRNYHHFGVFLPVATGSGDVFWTGNNLEFDGEYRYAETQAKLRETAGDVDLITRDRRLMVDAMKKIQAEPLPHAWLFVRKMLRYWLRVYEDIPRGEARQNNWAVFGALATTHYALLLCAVIGLRQINWRDDRAKMVMTFVFYYTLIHAATLAVARYRIPLLPLISIASAMGIGLLLKKFLAKENSAVIERASAKEPTLDFSRERSYEA